MRKIATLIVCVFLLISNLPSSIAAAPSSACRYTSDTKTQSGIKYVCLFYKGKSTWIHVPKRSVSRLSTYEKTKLKAYNEIRKQISSSTPKNIELNFVISPNFPKDQQSKYIAQINLATLAYDQFFAPNTRINVYFQTEKDEQFIDATPILARNKQDYSNFLQEWKLNRNKQHVVGLAASFNEFTGKPEGHTGVIVSSRTSEKSVTFYSEQVVAHNIFMSFKTISSTREIRWDIPVAWMNTKETTVLSFVKVRQILLLRRYQQVLSKTIYFSTELLWRRTKAKVLGRLLTL